LRSNSEIIGELSSLGLSFQVPKNAGLSLDGRGVLGDRPHDAITTDEATMAEQMTLSIGRRF
jgi:hypothetical protein